MLGRIAVIGRASTWMDMRPGGELLAICRRPAFWSTGGDSRPCLSRLLRDWRLVSPRPLADSAGRSWPRGSTIGDLPRPFSIWHYGKVVQREHGFSRDEVWCILQEIVAGVLGIDRERVTPEARFVEDLGSG